MYMLCYAYFNKDQSISGVDPVLGQSVVSGAESHTVQSSTSGDSGLG